MKVFILKPCFMMLIITLITGCVSLERVRPQALQPDDQNLGGIEDSLGLLVVNIRQPPIRLKLRGFVARNLNTQELYVFPFVDNAIMGSRLLQHTVVGDTLEHMIFLLDLPPAVYQITKMELFQSEFGYGFGNSTSYLNYPLPYPLRFEILPGAPTDLGQLNIEVISASVASEEDNFYRQALSDPILGTTSAATNAYLVTMAGTIRQLKGILDFTTPGHDENQLKKARGRYPVLRDTEFQKGRVWVGQ